MIKGINNGFVGVYIFMRNYIWKEIFGLIYCVSWRAHAVNTPGTIYVHKMTTTAMTGHTARFSNATGQMLYKDMNQSQIVQKRVLKSTLRRNCEEDILGKNSWYGWLTGQIGPTPPLR